VYTEGKYSNCEDVLTVDDFAVRTPTLIAAFKKVLGFQPMTVE